MKKIIFLAIIAIFAVAEAKADVEWEECGRIGQKMKEQGMGALSMGELDTGRLCMVETMDSRQREERDARELKTFERLRGHRLEDSQ